MSELDSQHRIHLEWMFENQPGLVRELHEQYKLREHLDAKLLQALRVADTMKQQRGFSEDEAFEVAMQSILAPADGPAMGDDPPDPVPWREQEEIYNRLESQRD